MTIMGPSRQLRVSGFFSCIWEIKYKKIKIGAEESNKANKIICGAKQLKTLRLIDTKKKFTGC